MAHGQHDDLIPMHRAQASRDFLQNFDYKIEWRDYPMPHSVCGEEIADIASFLVRLL
jgi:phospholipase/carboxylesterase